MRYGSLFAGIGGFDLGLDRAGMECAWQVEIDNQCNQILTQHWPNVWRFKDVKECGKENLEPVDLICGGFPCQDLSVAGKRSGLAGERSGLFFEFMRIIAELSPRWILIENVPGLLSSNGGRDMGTILGEVGKLGYGWTYRVLDAQYFGLAQRRRRVFIVGCLGDAGSTAKVLFEPESVCGDSPPSREKGKRIASPITRSFAKHGGVSAGKDSYPHNAVIAHALTGCKTATGRLDPQGQDFVMEKQKTSWDLQRMRIHDAEDVSPTLSQSDGKGGQRTPIIATFEQNSMAGRGTLGYDEDAKVAKPIKPQSDHQMIVSLAQNQRGELRTSKVHPQLTCGGGKPGEGYPCVALQGGGKTSQRSQGSGWKLENSFTLNAMDIHGIQRGMIVRRLTPTECERLQGFPDGWTEECSDSARYRMLGNAVAVPVAKWIGRRILKN